MKKKLCWNVFISDLNSKEIVPFNIFDHSSFEDGVKNYIKKYKKGLKKENITKKEQDNLLKELEENIRKELMYYFWSKYEWEIGVTEPFSDCLVDDYTKERKYPWKKIDVYSQVIMNWDVFFNYICGCLTK